MTSAKHSKTNDRALAIIVSISVLLFIGMSIIGNYGPDLMMNGLCFKSLGCNSGMFGFDFVVHLVSGLAEAALLLWGMRRFPALNTMTGSFWKDLLLILSLVITIAFLWELAELLPDQFRMIVLHENLISPDTLYQATNVDTMGDMIAALIGAALVAPFFVRKSKAS